jgi:hypothetical protein
MADNEALKQQLKNDPTFKSELTDRIKNAMGLRVPQAQPVNYNFDSYMLQDVEVSAAKIDTTSHHTRRDGKRAHHCAQFVIK